MADTDTDKVIAFLREKWGTAGCPQCKHDNWVVQDKVFELREFTGGKLVVGATNCGNTLAADAERADNEGSLAWLYLNTAAFK
jgi:hypothetical protein